MDTGNSYLLFPTPVFKVSLGREFTEKELNFITEQKKNAHLSQGNSISNTKQFLDADELKDIKTFCVESLKHVFKTWYASESEVYMTQSWANYAKEGDFHIEHMHPNSFLSGVIYVEEVLGNISFVKSIQPSIQPTYTEKTPFNQHEYMLQIEKGDLIIFPSDTKHFVSNIVYGDRISIAFNSFVKGSFGFTESATKLDI
jgi:uncharacterized protein (TIGR02466 family)